MENLSLSAYFKSIRKSANEKSKLNAYKKKY